MEEHPMSDPTFRFKKIGKRFLLPCVIQATMSLFYEKAPISVKGCAFFASVLPPQARFFGISRFATAYSGEPRGGAGGQADPPRAAGQVRLFHKSDVAPFFETHISLWK